MNGANLLSASLSGDRLLLDGGGEWTLANAADLDARLDEVNGAGARAACLDLSQVVRFDTYGAWLAERACRRWREAGLDVVLQGIREADQPLFDEIAQVNLEPPPARRPPSPGLVDELGLWFGGLAGDLRSFVVTTGALLAAIWRILTGRGHFRPNATVHQFDRVAWQAVPIIIMITLLIGAILAQQGFFHFRRFGADLYVVDMIGFLIMRELSVLLVAIMVAGRTGSSFTAELGSMKMREEIDALRTMGLDPVEILILPRILILVIALPVLTFVGSLAALFGSGLVAVFYAGLSLDLFIDRLRDAISMDHFLVGMIKAPFIGFVIGVIACNEGLATRGSAASLGRQTTIAVVKSIFMVIAMDGLFALFFSGISM